MTAKNLILEFQFNQYTLTTLLKDVSHEDSLRAPQPGVNCINWLLGHLIATRAELLKMLGATPHWSPEQCAVYGPRTEGLPASEAMSLAVLNAALEESLTHLEKGLPASEALLNQPSDKDFLGRKDVTWGDVAGTFALHEEYHVGQIGLLRRLFGKPGLF